MKQAALHSGLTVLLAFVLVLTWMGLRWERPAEEQAEVPAAQSEQAAAPIPADQQTLLRLETEQGIRQVRMDEYLLGVLCCEMPLDFEQAALQAQAVASRTFTLYHCQKAKHADADVCNQANCCQAWKSEAQLAELFGTEWTARREKAAQAIAATDGQVLTQNGELINAVFFSCSGGMTEPAAAVWGGEVSYLQAVDSPGEEIAASYTGQTAVPLELFRQTLTGAQPSVDLSGAPAGWFGTVAYTQGGGVASMEIGGVSFPGTQLRSLFGLNSTWFTVAVAEEQILFQTRGKGHRVGLSQYGAQAMALQGSTYDQILTHYYTGVTLTDAMVS